MTAKRIEDMTRKEARDVGERLYAEIKGAYTVAGTLIAVIKNVGVSLGTFADGTFNITSEGKLVAIERGLLPRDMGEDGQEPRSRDVRDGRAQIEEKQTIYGEPESWDDVENRPGALPSDVPMTDPGPHPPQPIAGLPAAISHRAGEPDGLPPIPQGEPVMGEDGKFYMPRRDRTDLDLVGKDGRFERIDQFADVTDPPLGGEGGAEGGVPEGPEPAPIVEPSLVTAATLPSMDFLQPGSGDKEQPAQHVKRPIAVSFPSPGGGSPEYPIEPGPQGTQPPPPPDPNDRAIVPQFQTPGGQRVREAEQIDRALVDDEEYITPDDKAKLDAEREAAEGLSPEEKFAAEREAEEKAEQARLKYTEEAQQRFADAQKMADEAAQGPAQKEADERQREALEQDADKLAAERAAAEAAGQRVDTGVKDTDKVEKSEKKADKDDKPDKREKDDKGEKSRSGGKHHRLNLKDEVKATSKVKPR